MKINLRIKNLFLFAFLILFFWACSNGSSSNDILYTIKAESENKTADETAKETVKEAEKVSTAKMNVEALFPSNDKVKGKILYKKGRASSRNGAREKIQGVTHHYLTFSDTETDGKLSVVSKHYDNYNDGSTSYDQQPENYTYKNGVLSKVLSDGEVTYNDIDSYMLLWNDKYYEFTKNKRTDGTDFNNSTFFCKEFKNGLFEDSIQKYSTITYKTTETGSVTCIFEKYTKSADGISKENYEKKTYSGSFSNADGVLTVNYKFDEGTSSQTLLYDGEYLYALDDSPYTTVSEIPNYTNN